jgi:plasmid stabilization system protein ParE
MKVVLADQAKKDLRWWRTYYRQTFAAGNATAAAHFAKAVELLTENAFAGRAVERHGLRRYPVHRTPFALIYRVKNDEIEMARVWDGRKDPEKTSRETMRPL